MKTVFKYLIEGVSSFGIWEIVLLLGYLSEKITDYFENSSRWDVHSRYRITPVVYETELQLKCAEDEGVLAAELSWDRRS